MDQKDKKEILEQLNQSMNELCARNDWIGMRAIAKTIIFVTSQDELMESSSKENVKKELTAKWRFWGGWEGNHDHRIEDATCTNCNYQHKTVYDIEDLPDQCPCCGAKMIGYQGT